MATTFGTLQTAPMKLRIADLRKQRGLTQEALSGVTLLSRITIANHERGVQGWNTETLRAYAEGLNVPEHELLGYDLPPTIDLPESCRRLAKLLHAMDERTARILLSVAAAQTQESQEPQDKSGAKRR